MAEKKPEDSTRLKLTKDTLVPISFLFVIAGLLWSAYATRSEAAEAKQMAAKNCQKLEESEKVINQLKTDNAVVLEKIKNIETIVQKMDIKLDKIK